MTVEISDARRKANDICNALVDQYEGWLKSQNLGDAGSADELLHEDLTTAQREWLEGFIGRWDSQPIIERCYDCGGEVLVPATHTRRTVRCLTCGNVHHLAWNALSVLSGDEEWIEGTADIIATVLAQEPDMLESRLTVDLGMTADDARYVLRAVRG